VTLNQHIRCRNLAKLLDVTPRTIRNWALSLDNPLPGKRIKGVWLFECEAVSKWLCNQENAIDTDKMVEDLFNNIKEYGNENQNT
jgi:phage terminase Nu1 subunit (DNA packaging protein)